MLYGVFEFVNGWKPSLAMPNLIFRESKANDLWSSLKDFYVIESTGCWITPPSTLLSWRHLIKQDVLVGISSL